MNKFAYKTPPRRRARGGGGGVVGEEKGTTIFEQLNSEAKDDQQGL